jgi:hypothetical protein
MGSYEKAQYFNNFLCAAGEANPARASRWILSIGD